MKRYFRLYFIALTFLTTIPVSDPINNITAKEKSQAIIFYPVIGAIIGLILCIFAWLFSLGNAPIGAILLTTVWVLITGALHLDGVADMADAWLGGFADKSKAFAIMKTPTTGPAGIVAIVLILAMKMATLSILLQQQQLWLLILVPLTARLSAAGLILFTTSAKESGLIWQLQQHLPFQQIYFVLIIFGLLLLYLSPLIFITTLLLSYILRQLMLHRLQGITGDTVGTSIEIIEAGTLTMIALFI